MEPSAFATSSASSFAPKLFSGVELIDRAWGGLYRGGSYLLYGRAASGRDLVTLRFAQTGAEHGEPCLFVSPARPKDLMIQAASIGFNLRHHYEDGTVKLMRIPPSLAGEGDEDDAILRSMRDLVALVRQHKPARLVFNDFMPFVLFRSDARFRAAFSEMLEHMDVLDMTTMLVMSEPANAQSKKVIDFIGEQMTGTIHLEMPENDAESSKRRVTLSPRLGHARKRIVELWDVNDLLDEPEAAYPVRPEPALLPAPEVETEPALVEAEAASSLPEPPATRGIRLGRLLADMPEGGADAAPAPAAPAHAAHPLDETLAPFVVPVDPTPLPAFDAFGADDEPARWFDGRMEHETATPTAPVVTPVIMPEALPPFPTPTHAPAPVFPAPAAPAMAGAATGVAATGGAAMTGSTASGLLDPRLDRDGFGARLQQHFDLHAQNGTPFLLVAMRLDRSAAALSAFTFDFVADVVGDALRPADDLLVDPASERLVVLLPGSDGDAANTFFTRLKQRLREDAPEQAEELLRAISAIAVANGRMFGSAEEFLAYALDTP